MVILYTWAPKPVEAVEAGVLPDIGHAALALDDAYVSFWPEIDSVVGMLSAAIKPRNTRNPSSYVEECDPDGPYMRREADFQDMLMGLNEARMLERWRALNEAPYDFATRNCSHVLLELLHSGLPEEGTASLDEPDSLVDSLAKTGNPLEDVFQFLRHAVATPFTDCTPESIRARVLKLAAAPDGSTVTAPSGERPATHS